MSELARREFLKLLGCGATVTGAPEQQSQGDIFGLDQGGSELTQRVLRLYRSLADINQLPTYKSAFFFSVDPDRPINGNIEFYGFEVDIVRVLSSDCDYDGTESYRISIIDRMPRERQEFKDSVGSEKSMSRMTRLLTKPQGNGLAVNRVEHFYHETEQAKNADGSQIEKGREHVMTIHETNRGLEFSVIASHMPLDKPLTESLPGQKLPALYTQLASLIYRDWRATPTSRSG